MMTDLRADLAGKKAFVTGGGTGIGRAVALALADAGAEVVITGRREGPLKEVAAENSRIAWHAVDVTDEKELVDAIASAGQIDIMVPNAGIAETAPLHKVTLDHWRKVFAINVEGVMICMREVLRPMAQRGWGRIVVISSMTAFRGAAYISAYSASKHAVVGLTKCAAEEVLKTGVTVNALCPGYVATPIVDRSIANITSKTKLTDEEALASLRDQNPFGRLIEPDEVAAAALWLCGPGSGAVTAQAIPITGGQV